jgi:hypothetical protein
MPSKTEIANKIGRKMILGENSGKVPPEHLEILQARYGDIILKIAQSLPRYSVSVGAVIGKCAIRYGHKKALDFCDTISNEKFKGPLDPAYLLWTLLLSCKGKKVTREIYKKSVTAVRAWCEDRTLTEIRAARRDVFIWGKDFSVPKDYPGYRELTKDPLRPREIIIKGPKKCACGSTPIALFKGVCYCGKCYKKNFVALK